MLVYVCSECMPAGLDSFDGPSDPRECIVCRKAELCREVDPSDAIRTLLGAKPAPAPSAPPAAAPSVPPALGALPPLPGLPGAKAGQ